MRVRDNTVSMGYCWVDTVLCYMNQTYFVHTALCKSLWPTLNLLYKQGFNDNPYLFINVFIKIQPENAGNIYII